MQLTDASKNIMLNTYKEWTRFVAERERLTQVANEVSMATRMIVQECMAFMKTHNLDIKCDTPDDMKIMGVSVHIDPLIEGNYPNSKVSVVLKCGGSSRSILINSNMSISAGGVAIPYEQFKKGIPTTFVANAAEFVSDSFLYVARTGGKEE
jgi:uncharacterized protein with NRDE domain